MINNKNQLAQYPENSSNNLFYKKLLEILIHDLNGSLNNIIMMSSGEFDKEDHLDFIPNINQSAQCCDSVIRGVLPLIKNETEASITKIILRKFVQNILDEQKSIFKKPAEISLNIDPDQVFFYNKLFLRCIFQNLIQNAYKYSSPDRILNIDISTSLEENYLMISVKDNGIGIDLIEYGHLLHKPFRQIDSDKKGFGIGLYLVYSIMEMAEGRVLVKSEPGKGTTFSLLFPKKLLLLHSIN